LNSLELSAFLKKIEIFPRTSNYNIVCDDVRYTFPMDFSQKAISQKAISQVATSQGYFPKWQLLKCAIS